MLNGSPKLGQETKISFSSWKENRFVDFTDTRCSLEDLTGAVDDRDRERERERERDKSVLSAWLNDDDDDDDDKYSIPEN